MFEDVARHFVDHLQVQRSETFFIAGIPKPKNSNRCPKTSQLNIQICWVQLSFIPAFRVSVQSIVPALVGNLYLFVVCGRIRLPLLDIEMVRSTPLLRCALVLWIALLVSVCDLFTAIELPVPSKADVPIHKKISGKSSVKSSLPKATTSNKIKQSPSVPPPVNNAPPPTVMTSGTKNQKEKEMLYEAYNALHTLAQVRRI